MARMTVVTSMLMLAATASWAAERPACLMVWVDENLPSQCAGLDIRAEGLRSPDVCITHNGDEATLQLKVTDCFQGTRAASLPPAEQLQRVIQAQVTGAGDAKALTAHDNSSWPNAVRKLYAATVAWHRQRVGRN